MMHEMQKVILLCGVPGSGKTWVMKQLGTKFFQVHHDANLDFTKQDLAQACLMGSRGDKPVIIDCPFAERELRAKMEALGLTVEPVFIIESAPVVAERYRKREGKGASQATLTRSTTIWGRAQEWNAHFGTSSEILEYLRNL